MNWKMFGFLIVLLAGLSFAAVYSDAYMERTYQFQLCKIDYGEATLGLASGYNPTLTQQAQLDTYLAALENDKDVLATATSKRGLTSLLRTSNSNFQKASTLYYKIYYPYIRAGGLAARNQVLADRKAAMEEYSLCRLCVIRPTDSRCQPKCSVVEGSETVTLHVVDSVSTVQTEFQFKTQIGDYLDRNLNNRYWVENDPAETYAYFYGFDSEDANPLQNTLGGYITNWDALGRTPTSSFYHIGADNFELFSDNIISNTRLNKNYVEKQDFWVFGENYYDNYEHMQLEGIVELAAYTVLFDAGGKYGLPLCPGDESVPVSVCAGNDKLESHRVFVKFLSQDWVISGIEGVASEVQIDGQDGESYQIDGAALKLAKEESYGIISTGGYMLSSNGYYVYLDDVPRETGADNSHPAMISVLNANKDLVCQEQVYPGETHEDLCSTGVNLHVYQTAPGLNFISKWAEMAIYSEEIELVSGQNLFGSDWNIHLVWANKDNDFPTPDSEYLREIVVSNIYYDGGHGTFLSEGEGRYIPNYDGGEAYRFDYNGIDKEGVGYDELKFEIVEAGTLSGIKDQNGGECYIDFQSAIHMVTGEKFYADPAVWQQGAWSDGTSAEKEGNEMWFFPSGEVPSLVSDCSMDFSGNKAILAFQSGDGIHAYQLSDSNEEFVSVRYPQAGEDGYIEMHGVTLWEPPRDGVVWLVENAGNYQSEEIVDGIGFRYDESSGTPQLVEMDSGESNMATTFTSGFEGNGYFDNGAYYSGFVSLRGTEFESVSATEKLLRVPDSVLSIDWEFKYGLEPDPYEGTFTLHEGEVLSLPSGNSIGVDRIDQELDGQSGCSLVPDTRQATLRLVFPSYDHESTQIVHEGDGFGIGQGYLDVKCLQISEEVETTP